MTNHEIASTFKLCGQLMEVHGENPFKAKSYHNASFQIDKLQEEIAIMSQEQIAALPGIGSTIRQKIQELLHNGSFSYLDELVNETPDGIREMLRMKGFGPKKINAVWKKHGIDTIESLIQAAEAKELAKMKGFGAKTEQTILESARFFLRHRSELLFAKAEIEASEILEQMSKLVEPARVSVSGQLRRKCNTISRYDYVVGSTENGKIKAAKGILQESNLEADNLSGKSATGIPVQISFCAPERFDQVLFETTGSEEHIAQVLEHLGSTKIIKEAQTEEEIYRAAKLNSIAPEMREKEIDITATPSADELIQESDIKGVIHTHSTYSDGRYSIRQMTDRCIELGYEYLVMSDHSKTAVYAGGLQEDRIIKQHQEIDQLNTELAPFKIFKSIESDILNDGSLDYEDDVLASFDLVIGSVHANLKMDQEKAMNRLLRAIENPYMTILGHMTARLLCTRPGFPVDHQKIIDACAEHQVVIELNANPRRLDMDWRHIPYALEKGVTIAINPDAHTLAGIEDIKYGVYSARKGGLKSVNCLNTLSLSQFEDFLLNNVKKRKI